MSVAGRRGNTERMTITVYPALKIHVEQSVHRAPSHARCCAGLWGSGRKPKRPNSLPGWAGILVGGADNNQDQLLILVSCYIVAGAKENNKARRIRPWEC